MRESIRNVYELEKMGLSGVYYLRTRDVAERVEEKRPDENGEEECQADIVNQESD